MYSWQDIHTACDRCPIGDAEAVPWAKQALAEYLQGWNDFMTKGVILYESLEHPMTLAYWDGLGDAQEASAETWHARRQAWWNRPEIHHKIDLWTQAPKDTSLAPDPVPNPKTVRRMFPRTIISTTEPSRVVGGMTGEEWQDEVDYMNHWDRSGGGDPTEFGDA